VKKAFAFLLIFVLISAFGISAFADSYTYNSKGKAVASPDVYVAESDISGINLGVGRLLGASDIKISRSGKTAVSDTDNSRVIITDTSFKSAVILKEFDNNGTADSLKTPAGLFFTDDDHLYVCDRENMRILEFDSSLKYIRAIENPKKELLPDGFSFYPSAVAVDKWGTVYCISYSSANGYLQFDKSGEFKGFMGSPKTNLSLPQKFWRGVQTKEQRQRTAQSIPVNFNNLTIDADGFVYTIEINPNKEDTALFIQSGVKEGLFMPIKKFNFNGDDVLKRLGFFAPAGDIDFEKNYPKNEKENGQLWASAPSSITLCENGIYCIADSKRNKIFGYDGDGNLLYAFAGTGSQTGLFSQLEAIAYHDGSLYALDKNHGTITKFALTDYGRLLHETIEMVSQRKFDTAADNWSTLLSYNQNLTVGYIGLGRAYLEQKNYKDAMEYFRLALDIENYTTAFSLYREKIMGDWFLVIPAGIILLFFLISFSFSKMRKYNLAPAGVNRGIKSHLIYAQHVIFHPFDGFWDVKHEKRGSAKASAIFLALAAICVAFQNKLSGFSFNRGSASNPFTTALVIIAAALVFCLSNWCLTSLTNGKGSMKDIFTVVGYSAVPLIIFSIPITVLSNVLTSKEAGFVLLFTYIAYIWTALLLFSGIMTAQQYSVRQNVMSLVFTLIGIIIIVFLAFLLFNLVGRISGFANGIMTEVNLR